MTSLEQFDAVVVGGGPSGATAAESLAKEGHRVLLLDRAGRIKPCGGAIPPRAIRDFDIAPSQIKARITSARMVSPADCEVDMPIEDGYVGMVDREHFDPYLRARAAAAGADLRHGTFTALDRTEAGGLLVRYRPKTEGSEEAPIVTIAARCVIGADGARSAVGKAAIPNADKVPCVFAYHEIVKSPTPGAAAFDPERCDVYYQGKHSPDFYSWIFPHGETASIGTGSAVKGFSLRGSVKSFRQAAGLEECETIRREGAPIPLKPLKKWDNGKDVVLAGDAAGVVAPASGEGIYYAMVGGELAGAAVHKFLATGDAKALAEPRKHFMKAHGRVFFVLGIMQHFWYRNDKRRERFVSICKDKDVQKLTWDAYMNKELVKAKPAAHMRIFFKDLAHLFGLVSPR